MGLHHDFGHALLSSPSFHARSIIVFIASRPKPSFFARAAMRSPQPSFMPSENWNGKSTVSNGNASRHASAISSEWVEKPMLRISPSRFAQTNVSIAPPGLNTAS